MISMLKFLLFLVSILILASAQDLHTEIRKQKIASCTLLLRYKVAESQRELNRIIQGLPKEYRENAMDKLLTDVLIGCVNSIGAIEALKVFENPEDADLIIENQKYLTYNPENYKNLKNIEFTSEQQKLFEEISSVQQELKINPPKLTDPLPLKKFGWGYMLAVIGLIVAFIYWAIRRLFRDQRPKKIHKKYN